MNVTNKLTNIPRLDSDGEDDVFFDACGDVRSSPMAASLSVGCSTGEAGCGYELWASEPISVKERRHRFLEAMGFLESVSTGSVTILDQWHREITTECSFHDLEERISSTRDVDNRRRFIAHQGQHNDLTGGILEEEAGSDKTSTSNEPDVVLRFSRLVQKFLRNGFGCSRARGSTNAACRTPKQCEFKILWGSFTRKKHPAARISLDHVDARSLNSSSTLSTTKVHQRNKKWMEFSAVYMCQEIQAHEGLISVMKVSSSGWYLASGGEDCAVRIWQITEIESSPSLYGRDTDTPLVHMNRSKGVKNKLGKGQNRSLAVIPKKVFRISETPLHEFHGHTSDVLDMAWSKSDFLLTSSKDNTIRMWRVGCDGCQAVFRHGDYVTCVQFNPVDERYFISGSIDGKVRVWDVLEKRVIDWDDTRDVITAISYRPDGKGFVVGSVTGTRFYDHSGKNIELNRVMRVKKKKKSAANKVTSVQFSEDDPSRIIITSADSKIRVSEGHGIIKKTPNHFRSFTRQRSSKALLPPSLTSDGRYLVSASMDSNVCIWDFDGKGRRRVRSCEVFFSEGVTAVAPWTRMHRSVKADAPTTLCQCHDRECCSFGTWFFAEGMRVSAMWPEDINCARIDDCHQSKVAAAAWNMVMLTGSRVGVIRAFHNYGLPVKL
ncbi:hypothetical protein GUJ93_ZPchr0002g24739 [Zizania palustris]|uniref:Uncharacterized protein n=1 Tax=Zizania palustris TaxID=103762 RepID=A0A8J5S9P9_ZIZPA|nr:hypothetical protein GUJ93_ZPchr0002g24739 [Zizania palustris]